MLHRVAWLGNILRGGLASPSVIRLTPDGDWASDQAVIPMGRRIRKVVNARDGSMLALPESPNAELLRLSPAPSVMATTAVAAPRSHLPPRYLSGHWPQCGEMSVVH